MQEKEARKNGSKKGTPKGSGGSGRRPREAREAGWEVSARLLEV